MIGDSTLFVAQIPSQYLTYPYYRDHHKPLSDDEFMALNIFTLIFARGLCRGESVLSKEYMTLAAKLDLANECLVHLSRMICTITHKLRPQDSFAHVLGTQQLSEGNLMEIANLNIYSTPAMTAALFMWRVSGARCWDSRGMASLIESDVSLLMCSSPKTQLP